VSAELAGQRPLLERAAAGDPEAFARIHDDQVEGVHRYLLAWTGDRARAAELTDQVFRSARRWLPTRDQEEAGPDPQREVLVLRLLCGHSLDHTAHLSGYPAGQSSTSSSPPACPSGT
jgi:DNA-directed RNA polymerase specialized sigma24 family protein